MLLNNFFQVFENEYAILTGFILSLVFFLFCIFGYKKDTKAASKFYVSFLLLAAFAFLSFGLRISIIYYSFYFVLIMLLGNLVTQKVFNIHEKSLLYLCVDFLIGFYGFGIIYFLVSQRVILQSFGYNFNNIVMFAIYAALIFYYALNFKSLRCEMKSFNDILDEKYTLVLASAVLLFAYLIVFNLNNVFTWSWLYDKNIHLKTVFIEDFLKYKSFPFEKLYPFGFQEALYIPTIINQSGSYSMIAAYDFFGYFNLLCIFVVPFEFARKLKGSVFSCFLASALAVFFGAIGGPFINSYLGFFNISTSIYHNTTEFFATAPAALFAYFAYLWYAEKNTQGLKKSLYADSGRNMAYAYISIIFIDLSFLNKPNAYMVCAPFICIILLIMFITKRIKLNSALISYALIFLPLIYWTGYPRISGIKSESSIPPQICSFGYIYGVYFLKQFHHYFFNNPYVTFAIVAILSAAGISLPMIFTNCSSKKTKNFYYYFLMPVFVLSILIACLIVQGDSQKDDGNYMWQISLIGVSLMPFLAKFTEDIKSAKIKKITYTVLFLHIIGGLWHLIVLNVFNKL